MPDDKIQDYKEVAKIASETELQETLKQFKKAVDQYGGARIIMEMDSDTYWELYKAMA